ncbi:hypothetical protein [uncultured Helicobacter sp.]|uniref:hypothetical protein n=2 Tax=uncultured Helicobacter sp. TaxID=175537 RepID=UPI002635AC97|nr:hypothetical protein [uncultured Helicobacter sp.]
MKRLFRYICFAFLLSSTSYAQSRDDYRISIGGVYGLYQANGEKDATDIGASLAFNYRSIYNRVFYSTAVEWSGGSFTRKDEKASAFWLGNYHIKLGFNPFSQANLLFVNVGYSWDYEFTGYVADPKKPLETGLHMVGLDLQGFIKANEKLTYEYNVGYHYVFHGYHYLEETRSGINDYSYAIKGYVGYTYQLSPKVAYFLNLKAKYYDLATSKFNTPDFNRPKTKHLISMVELGLQF